MSNRKQLFFLIPLMHLNDDIYDEDDRIICRLEQDSPLLQTLLKAGYADTTCLLRSVHEHNRFNYVSKCKVKHDVSSWILDTLPSDYIKDYSSLCTRPLLICTKKPESLVRYTVTSQTKTEDQCYLHLLMMYIQYIQIQDPTCSILSYLNSIIKKSKTVLGSSTVDSNRLPPYRSKCCFTKLFVRIRRNDEDKSTCGEIGILYHEPCIKEDITRIIRYWLV